MSLENLIDSNINISNLRPVEERNTKNTRAYSELKQSPLYDWESGYWNMCMNETSAKPTLTRRTSDQLLGALILDALAIEDPRTKFVKLKQTEGLASGRIGEQLLGVFSEAKLGDVEVARKQYEELQRTESFDHESRLWKETVSDGWDPYNQQNKVKDVYSSKLQLLNILILSALSGEGDKRIISEAFERLKSTPLYGVGGIWREAMVKDPRTGNFALDKTGAVPSESGYCHTEDQLLGILVECDVDRNVAELHLEDLKNSLFHGDNLWNEGANILAKKAVNLNRYSRDQLLGIIVEAKLGAPEFSSQEEPPLPETRNF